MGTIGSWGLGLRSSIPGWSAIAVATSVLLGAVIVVGGCSGGQPTPAPAVGKVETAGSESEAAPAVSEVSGPGRDVYVSTCAPCHGERGGGIPSARLDSRKFVSGLGEAGLTTAISAGKGLMPAWFKAKGGTLGDEDIRNVASYLLTYSASLPEPAAAPTPARSLASGEATSVSAPATAWGKELFESNCSSCHAKVQELAAKATPAKVQQMAIALNEAQSLAVFDYLRTLSEQPATPIPPSSGTVPGTAPLRGKPPGKVPHSTKGREGQCLECHGRGKANPFPVNHIGRTLAVCVACHGEGQMPPPVTHEIKGREGRCLGCHAMNGILPVSSSHQGRREESCIVCHETVAPSGSGSKPKSAPAIPHHVTDTACVGCHRGGGMAKRLPLNHEEATQAVCVLCHKPRASPKPQPPPAGKS